ncbi:MAG: DUF2236 domain-containing protein [Saprospiraceae bacterium]|nr:DUF2236 domain-containing protein [Saprospiraceae bacterium]
MLSENGPEEARQFFNRLIREIELPESDFPISIRPFFEATRQLPDHADWHQIRIANALFLDHGPKFLVFLYYKSLPQLYTCAAGAEVLIRTGRLSRQGDDLEIFARRIAETGQFLMDVMSPDGLLPGGKGIQAIQKVRLIHASIRKFIGTPEWNTEMFGAPINQEDMALTLQTFCVSITDALAQFGITESPEKLEGFYKTWTYIGHLLGITPELVPPTASEGRKLLEEILTRKGAASEAGQLLTNALLKFANYTLKGRFEKVPPLLITHLIGKERSRMLGVYAPEGCLGVLLPEFISTLFRLGENLEDRFEGPKEILIEELGRQTMKAMLGYFDQVKGRKFVVADQFVSHWNL